MIWFTSDEHYGHSNIIKYCNRPFKDVNEMNQILISNFNTVVSNDDTIYHLGDFAFNNHKKYLDQLKGNHYLIKGNHEGSDWRQANFKWVKDVAMIRGFDAQDIFCSHYAHRTWNRAHHGVWHVFGHDHGRLPDYYKSCDVGVDAWNYFPVSWDELKERFKNKENIRHN